MQHDSLWLKQLAGATFSHGTWSPSDTHELEEIKRHRLEALMGEIGLHLREALEIFNLHSSVEPVHMLDVDVEQKPLRRGFILVRSLHQVRVLFDQTHIHVELLQTKGFVAASASNEVFRPVFDSLGSLYFQRQAMGVMTREQLIKHIILTLVQASFTAKP